MFVLPLSAFAQITPAGQQRYAQQIIVNGQQSQGVLIVENGTIQTNTCSYPQSYTTVDQSSSGWACFDQSTGMWLLHALPPASSQQTFSYQQPAVSQPAYVYQQAPVYVAPPVAPVYSYPSPYFY